MLKQPRRLTILIEDENSKKELAKVTTKYEGGKDRDLFVLGEMVKELKLIWNEKK